MQEISYQPRPQGLLLVQNGGSAKPLGTPRLPKWLQRFVTMFHVNTMKCRSFRLNNGFQIAENKQGRQTLETTSEKACYDSWSTVFPRISARALF